MCTCGESEPCNTAISQHCSSVLIRLTPCAWNVCEQTVKAYLKGHPIKTPCRFDAKKICQLLCVPRGTTGLYEHRYDAVCNEIAKDCKNFQDIGTILMRHGAFLSAGSFRRFCETIDKFAKVVLFHPQHRHLVCAAGHINVFSKTSLYESVRSMGSSGIALTDLGGTYKAVGQDIAKAIERGHFVIVCNRLYSTSVAPFATPGALEQWLSLIHKKQ